MSIHSQEKGRRDQYLCVFNTAYYHHNQLCIIIVWILSCIHFFRIRLSSQFLLATVLIVLSSYRLLTVCFPADFPKYLLSLPNYTQARRISQVVNAWESPPPLPSLLPPPHIRRRLSHGRAIPQLKIDRCSEQTCCVLKVLTIFQQLMWDQLQFLELRKERVRHLFIINNYLELLTFPLFPLRDLFDYFVVCTCIVLGE